MKRQITLALKGIAAAAVIYTGLSFASSASAMTLENSLQLDDDLVADSLGAITAFNTYCPHYELYSPTLSKSQVDLFIQAIDEAVDVNEKLLAAHNKWAETYGETRASRLAGCAMQAVFRFNGTNVKWTAVLTK